MDVFVRLCTNLLEAGNVFAELSINLRRGATFFVVVDAADDDELSLAILAR